MKLQRRNLLKASCFLPVAASTSLARGDGNSRYAYLQVRTTAISSMLRAGDFILLDTGVRRFSEEGFYLFPAWGKPALYKVSSCEKGMLAFSLPGEERELWRMSGKGPECSFAGFAQALVRREDSRQLDRLHALYRPLSVPQLPGA